MSHAEFFRLSRSLATEEAARPEALRRRLSRWVFGVHAAVGAFMLLPLLAAGAVLLSARWQGVTIAAMGGAAILVSVVLGMVMWGVLVAILAARGPVPQGLELARPESPALFSELDALCRRMRVAPFDGVLLSTDCNAQVVEGPRPGRDGRRRYLVLGVPLMQGLSAEEMRAVLAHELAHRGDRRPLVRAMERVQRWLMRLQPAAPGTNTAQARGIFDAPVAWFAPRFQALVQVFRRRQELEADAAAATVTGKEPVASALARLAVLDGLYAEWCDAVAREAARHQHSPPDLPDRWSAAVASADSEKAQLWLDRARREARRLAATHPTLPERWSALGVPPIESPPPAPTVVAWEAWLGESRGAVTRKFSTWWGASAEAFWQQQRNRAHEAEAVRREPEPGPDTAPEARERWAWDQACAAMVIEGKEAARPLVEAVLALNPRHEGAGQWLVREGLQADDPSAIDLLRSLPPAPGIEELWIEAAALHGRAGRAEEQARACAEADAAARRWASLNLQCGPLQPGDIIRPHTMAPEHTALLAERAAILPPVAMVAVVRKELAAKPGEIFHLIALEITGAKPPLQQECAQELVQTLQAARIPGLWRVIPMVGPAADFNRVLFTVPGACIYDRRHASR